jgi:hypothetical protein
VQSGFIPMCVDAALLAEKFEKPKQLWWGITKVE